MASNSSTLALLIDGDNVSPKIITGLMAEIANYGTASVRRIYADWTRPESKGWKECLLKHSIIPIQQFAYTTGKNSTDGAVIIDAMDLLYTGRFSSFCIGVTVYGFGERKTNRALIAACDQFVYFDVLVVEEEPEEEPLVTPQAPTQTQSVVVPVLPPQQVRMPLDKWAINGIVMAMNKARSYSDDWVNLAEVGGYLKNLSPNLHARNYGYGRLRDFVEASGIVEVKLKNMGDKPPFALVRFQNQRLSEGFSASFSPSHKSQGAGFRPSPG